MKMASLISSKLALTNLQLLQITSRFQGCSKTLCFTSKAKINNIKEFSTDAIPETPEIPKQLDVFKDLGMFRLEQKLVTNLGQYSNIGGSYGQLVDYNLMTKENKFLFIIEHFYGSTSPYFDVKIKNKIEDKYPIIAMKLIRNIQNEVFGVKYFATGEKYLGTMELFENNKREYVLKNTEEKVSLHLLCDGDYGWATKVRIYEPGLTKIIGKISKTGEIFIRSKLDAKIQFPVSLDLLSKVQLIGATIYLMSKHE